MKFADCILIPVRIHRARRAKVVAALTRPEAGFAVDGLSVDGQRRSTFAV